MGNGKKGWPSSDDPSRGAEALSPMKLAQLRATGPRRSTWEPRAIKSLEVPTARAGASEFPSSSGLYLCTGY